MAYCTLVDLVDRAGTDELLQVADRDHDGIVDASVVDAAIDAAGVQIDAWLGTRYALPLQPVPAIVKSWAVALARYTLHRDGAPDHVVRDQKDALTGLQAAASGRMALPSALTGGQPATPAGGGIGVSSEVPVFRPGSLDGWL